MSGKDYDVLSCNYNFSQGTGQDGRPTSDVKGGQIQLSVMSSEDTALMEWMLDPAKTQDGEINFYKSDNSEQVMKKMKFSKGFCVSHAESFSNNGSMVENIVVSAQKIQMGNAEHEKVWPK